MTALHISGSLGTGRGGWGGGIKTWLRAEERPAYLPVVEDREGEGLPLRVCAEVGLKAKGVDGRDEGLDGVERGAWNGRVLGDVTPAR